MTTDRRGDELRPIVRANMLGNTTREEQVGQNVQHAIRRHAATHFQRQTLARVLVGDRKPLQRLSGGRAVMDEVPGPHVVLVLVRDGERNCCRYAPNAAFSASFVAL